MGKIGRCIWFIFILGIQCSFAQSDRLQWLDGFLENIPSELLEENDFEDVQEYFIQVLERPFDLNIVDRDQLNSLLFLSPFQIENILRYRERLNGFLSIYELQSIEGLTLEEAYLLSHFVRVKDDFLVHSMEDLVDKNKINTELFFQVGRNLQVNKGMKQKNTDKSHYLGDLWKSLMKIKVNNSEYWKFQLNLEKDAGEQWWNSNIPQKVNFISASFQLNKWKNWENIIIGNYGVQFGEGLGLWMGFASSKGAIFHGIAKSEGKSRMHTSVNEVQYLRGITGELKWRGLKIQPYLSYRKFDASLKWDSINVNYVTNINKSGFQRTPTELNNYKTLPHYLMGLNVQEEFKGFRIGLNYFYSKFGVPFKPDSIGRTAFNFSGNQFHNMSLYGKGSWNNLYYFGEVALHDFNHKALLVGGLLALGKDFSLSLLYRDYDKAYHSLFTHAFSERSSTQNEKGLYFGWLYQPNKYISWIHYLDIYRFPWMKFGVDKPSSGLDFMSEFKWTPQRKSLLKLRFKYEVKDENLLEEKAAYTKIQNAETMQIKLDVNHAFHSNFELRAKYYHQNLISNIYVLDAFFNLFKTQVQLNTRVSYMHVRSEESEDPIYVFENDVVFGHGVRPYNYPGTKYYVNLRYRINRNHSIWLNWTQSNHPQKTSIGSGLEEIEGSMRQSFKIAWRWK